LKKFVEAIFLDAKVSIFCGRTRNIANCPDGLLIEGEKWMIKEHLPDQQPYQLWNLITQR